MRFMMLMYPDAQAEAGVMPSAKQMEDMIKYNGELGKAGVLLALDGLQPTSKGVRVTFEGGKPQVVDGPFTESKEIVGGYWIIEVKSKEEAIDGQDASRSKGTVSSSSGRFRAVGIERRPSGGRDPRSVKVAPGRSRSISGRQP